MLGGGEDETPSGLETSPAPRVRREWVNPKLVLTPAQVVDMREAAATGAASGEWPTITDWCAANAHRWGVALTTVHGIITGVRRQDIGGPRVSPGDFVRAPEAPATAPFFYVDDEPPRRYVAAAHIPLPR